MRLTSCEKIKDLLAAHGGTMTGLTPLQEAVCKGLLGDVQTLLAAGADVNATKVFNISHVLLLTC